MDIKENFKGHLSTINHHKMEVMRLCFKVGLYKQGLMHDLSKYSPKEFISGVVFYTGIKVRTLRKDVRREKARRGFTIREETGITLNTG